MHISLALSVALAASLLSSCNSLFVTPGKFHLYKCEQLVPQTQSYVSREKVLRELIDRAKLAQGGGVIAAAAYGSEYAEVQGNIDELRKEAAEKKCNPQPPVIPAR